jgi:hypothetical protein
MPAFKPRLVVTNDRPFVVSYAAWWRLPPPLPPRPLPMVCLGVVILLIVVALLFAEAGGMTDRWGS